MQNLESDVLVLIKEIDILRSLNSKGVIRIHAVFEEVFDDENEIFVVMEHL